jgi:hypothetical protein
MRTLALLLIITLGPAVPCLAGAGPDTLRRTLEGVAGAEVPEVAADTLATPATPKPAPVTRGIGFAADSLSGRQIHPERPARRPAADPTWHLMPVPGGFVYDLGPHGWPHSWTYHGLSPNRIGLQLERRPYVDLFSGRPRYDLLPIDLVAPLRLTGEDAGRAATVVAGIPPFEAPEPLTELRYMSSGTGLQSVTAFHTQERRRELFGQDGLLGLLAAYAGRSSGGEYPPGSELRGGRHLYARVRYEQPAWSAEVSNMNARLRTGAHGGVVIRGDVFESVFERFGATTRRPDAERQTFRNDLSLALRAATFGTNLPLDANLFWTSQIERFVLPPDTVSGRAHRIGGRIEQRMFTPFTVLEATAWTERVEPWHALEAAPTRAYGRLGVRDGRSMGGIAWEGRLGIESDRGHVSPVGSLSGSVRAGGAELRLEASHTSGDLPYVFLHGYGAPASGIDIGPPMESSISGAVRWHGGAFDATLQPFISRTGRPVDAFAAAEADTVAMLAPASPLLALGTSVDLGWRRTAGRGLYAEVHATVLRIGEENDPLHRRIARATPDWTLFGRVGFRALLFMEDLDLDVYLQGRSWSAMTGRTLHPATGLLVIPRRDAMMFNPSGTLDLYIEGGVREAMLFIAWENLLSGTVLQRGNLIAPIYPLPERRFRFGVHWPIRD